MSSDSFVVQNCVCPSCNGPLICHHRPKYKGVSRSQLSEVFVACANFECRGTRRVTCEEVFRGPPPQPAA